MKLPYYLRALDDLRRLATARSLGRCLVGRRRLEFKDGSRLELSSLLDLLVVKETLWDDVYGLRDLEHGDGLIVDVGAGIGDFTIAAARRFPDVLVVAFEPSPVAFELLCRNVAAGGHANVRLAQAAVGTRGRYVLGSIERGPRASAVAARRGNAISVDGTRLDAALPYGPIRLLKIDCEGMELDVLESAVGVMDRVDRVVVEYHRHLVPDADSHVLAFLRSRGLTARSRVDPYDTDIGYVSASRLE